jgi:hypothetical protein
MAIYFNEALLILDSSLNQPIGNELLYNANELLNLLLDSEEEGATSSYNQTIGNELLYNAIELLN